MLIPMFTERGSELVYRLHKISPRLLTRSEEDKEDRNLWRKISKGEEVSLLGLIHNTVQAVIRGEETFGFFQKGRRTIDRSTATFNFIGHIVTLAVDLINTIDKNLLNDFIDKSLEPLIPEKYRDPDATPIEFMRKGGFFTD